MELRLYSFCSFYLSSIQQGIQTGHAAVDLVREYNKQGDESYRDMVNDWADNHKTFIILNGGDHTGICAARNIVEASTYPYRYFYESFGALNGLLTCAVVLLPECVFNARFSKDATEVNDFDTYVYTPKDDWAPTVVYTPEHKCYDLIRLIRGSRLAS